MNPIEPIPLEAIQSARERVRRAAIRTPLVRLNVDDAPAEISLKLENLQPIGSFKVRGAANAIAMTDAAALSRGVYTASAGNMAQGVAFVARQREIPCSVIVPDNAPQTKLAAVSRLGGTLIKVSYDEWWRVVQERHFPGLDATFIHPVSDPNVIAGNGTIGLEILDDLPDVEAVVVPFGGGGLSSGIASAIKVLKPSCKVYGCECDTAAPLAASLAAGGPQNVDHTPSFVDGIGGKGFLPEMWPLVSSLLAGSLVSSISEVAAAVKLLMERNRVIAEGAGACSVAAALAGQAGTGKVVCVVSGGNIDASKLITILGGEVP